MKSSYFDTPDHQETLFLSLFWQKQIIFFNFFFFYQNHGLAPLKVCEFWPYESVPFLWSKKVSFLFITSRNSIFKLLFDQKINNENF